MPLQNYDPSEGEFPVVPEGKYTLQIKEEPEVRRSRSGQGTFMLMRFFATHHETDQRLDYVQTFVKWDPIYRLVLLALGGKEGSDGVVHTGSMGAVVGKRFDAEIENVEHHKYPDRKQSKICNILVPPPPLPPKKSPNSPRVAATDDVPPPTKIKPKKDELPY